MNRSYLDQVVECRVESRVGVDGFVDMRRVVASNQHRLTRQGACAWLRGAADSQQRAAFAFQAQIGAIQIRVHVAVHGDAVHRAQPVHECLHEVVRATRRLQRRTSDSQYTIHMLCTSQYTIRIMQIAESRVTSKLHVIRKNARPIALCLTGITGT